MSKITLDQLITEKHERFKELCNKIDPNNEWVYWLQQITKDVFMSGIKQRYVANPTITSEEIYNSIILASEIDENKIEIDDRTKIKRYCEFFLEIVKKSK